MWLKQCHKPPIWEWIKNHLLKNGDLRDDLLLF